MKLLDDKTAGRGMPGMEGGPKRNGTMQNETKRKEVRHQRRLPGLLMPTITICWQAIKSERPDPVRPGQTSQAKWQKAPAPAVLQTGLRFHQSWPTARAKVTKSPTTVSSRQSPVGSEHMARPRLESGLWAGQ